MVGAQGPTTNLKERKNEQSTNRTRNANMTCDCIDICLYRCGMKCKSTLIGEHYAKRTKNTTDHIPVEPKTFAASSYIDGTSLFELKRKD